MKIQTLKVTARDETGTGPARRQRVIGDIPAVIYGDGGVSTPITVNTKAFHLIMGGGHGEHAIVQVEVENKPELSGPSVIKDVQHHPIRNHIVHADFLRIKLNKPIQTLIPIVLVGHCVGLVEGGVPDQQLRELEVECLPLETPESFEVDITELTIGSLLHVSDLTAPEGIKILTDDVRTVIAIHAPRVVKSETDAEEVVEEGEAEAEG